MTSVPPAPQQRDGHEPTVVPPSGSGVPGDIVELELPADPAYLGVVRTACAGLGARLDLTLDEIEDLRIAVDEACSLVLPHGRGADGDRDPGGSDRPTTDEVDPAHGADGAADGAEGAHGTDGPAPADPADDVDALTDALLAAPRSRGRHVRTPDQRLRATFTVGGDTLDVRVVGPALQLPDESSYAWAVLEALAGDVTSGSAEDGSWITLSHTRVRAG